MDSIEKQYSVLVDEKAQILQRVYDQGREGRVLNVVHNCGNAFHARVLRAYAKGKRDKIVVARKQLR